MISNLFFFRRGPGGAGGGRKKLRRKALQETTTHLVTTFGFGINDLRYTRSLTLLHEIRLKEEQIIRYTSMTLELPPFLNYPGG